MKTVGITSGYFDVLHKGHALMLNECKRYCDHLIVGVHSGKIKTPQPDGRYKADPIWSPEDRLYMVLSNRYVDEAFIYNSEQELYDYLEYNSDRLDVRILGEDHKGKSFTGDNLKIKSIFNSRNHTYSSTNIINEIIQKRT